MAKYSLETCPHCQRETYAPQHLDARGIFISYACDQCWPALEKKYRPEIFTDSQYETDEPIEPEDY